MFKINIILLFILFVYGNNEIYKSILTPINLDNIDKVYENNKEYKSNVQSPINPDNIDKGPVHINQRRINNKYDAVKIQSPIIPDNIDNKKHIYNEVKAQSPINPNNIDTNKICINDECEDINKNDKIIEKLDMINNRLDIIIKFKGMNKTDKEIKEELKTGIFILLKIFGTLIGIIIGIVFIIINCINCEI